MTTASWRDTEESASLRKGGRATRLFFRIQTDRELEGKSVRSVRRAGRRAPWDNKFGNGENSGPAVTIARSRLPPKRTVRYSSSQYSCFSAQGPPSAVSAAEPEDARASRRSAHPRPKRHAPTRYGSEIRITSSSIVRGVCHRILGPPHRHIADSKPEAPRHEEQLDAIPAMCGGARERMDVRH